MAWVNGILLWQARADSVNSLSASPAIGSRPNSVKPGQNLLEDRYQNRRAWLMYLLLTQRLFFPVLQVIKRLTSSVSCALDEAAAALNRMRTDPPPSDGR